MKNKLITDLSKITTINEQTLEKLSTKCIWCICDAVEESIYNGETLSEIELGIGTLYILIEDDSIKYKFKPNKQLETNVINTVYYEKNPLQAEIEKSLVSKFNNTYKDLT